jgi:hypothetical protein
MQPKRKDRMQGKPETYQRFDEYQILIFYSSFAEKNNKFLYSTLLKIFSVPSVFSVVNLLSSLRFLRPLRLNLFSWEAA